MRRRVRPDEIPRFGSVWYYGDDWKLGDVCYIAIGLTPPMRDHGNQTHFLVSVCVTQSGFVSGVQSSMVWFSFNGKALERWHCLDEGSDA